MYEESGAYRTRVDRLERGDRFRLSDAAPLMTVRGVEVTRPHTATIRVAESDEPIVVKAYLTVQVAA